MDLSEINNEAASYQALPKVELHRHLEGSLRLETLIHLVETQEIDLPLKPTLRSLVQMETEDPLTFSTFLSKFQTLRLFYRSPEIISRLTYEVIADAAADNIQYLELRFTPVALSRARGFLMGDVMDWVSESAQKASADLGITVRLIASFNRHEPVSLAEQVAQLAVDRKGDGIVALDVAGNEAEFSAKPFAPVLREAQASGLALTVHGGEWGGAENVREALLELHADRIGHGVRVLEDSETVALAREKRTPFEVCISSNYQTGSIPALSAHPITRMLNLGLNATLNTDDPSVFRITLSDEYRIACQDLGLPGPLLAERILAAARAAFLPEAEKSRLVERLRAALLTSALVKIRM